MPKFAANLSMMFNEVDFLDRFEAASKAGFKAVEFLFPYDHPAEDIAAKLKASGLEQALFNLPPGDWAAGDRGFAAIPGKEAVFEAALEKALDYAEVIGNELIHVMSGVMPAGADKTACHGTLIANLKRAAPIAAARGKTLIVEPINPRDIPRYALNSQFEGRAVVEAVGADNVGLQFDFYHCQIVDGDLAKTFEAMRDITRHVQIAGVPERHEPDIGEINYPYLFDLIDASGYDGWVGCEYRPKSGTLDGLGWIKGRL
jgi:hydroxypyruvate isomerase